MTGSAQDGWRRALLPLALLVVAAAYLDTLRHGFTADAGFLLAENRYLDGSARAWDTLTHDYFWSSAGASIPYWRPFTKLSWLLEARLLGRGAIGFHAVQLAWLVAAAAGVAALARRLGVSAPWAAAAALAFGLHPAAAEPGCLLMARSDLVVAAAILGALAAWHAWSTTGGVGPAIAHVVAVVVALGSKEIAVVLPVAITCWAIALGRGRDLARLAPAWLLTGAYLWARARVVGPVEAVALDPLRVLTSVGGYAAGLVPLRLSTGVHNLSIAEARAPATLIVSAVACVAIAAAAILAVRRRHAPALLLIAVGAGSLLPVTIGPTPHVPGIGGKFPLADRWLLLAAACTCVAVAYAAARAAPRLQRVIAGALALWALASLAIAPARHRVFASDEALLELEDQEYEDTPPRFRTAEDDCRARERRVGAAIARGAVEEALSRLAAAHPGCADDDALRFDLASVLSRLGRFAEARPLAEALLAEGRVEPRFRGPLAYMVGVARLRTGDPAGGARALLLAKRAGVTACALHARLAECAQADGDDAAARRFAEELRRCQAGEPR